MKKSKIKILPMEFPKIKSYPYYGDLLSVISNNEFYKRWLYNNFIQLNYPIYYEKDGARLDFFSSLLWETCPFVTYQKIARDFMIYNWEDILEFLVTSIDSGFYCRVVLDTYFVEHYDSYNKIHVPHDIFIYGYDLNKKMFYVADNFKSGKYSYEIVTFAQIINGYKSEELSIKDDWLNGIEMLRLKDSNKFYGFNYSYKLDPLLIKDMIANYLNSEITALQWNRIPSEQWKKGKDFYGVDVYSQLLNYLDFVKNKRMSIDLRPFYVFMEHKEIMLERIEYMGKNNYLENSSIIREDYKKIVQKAKIVNSLWIKYYINNDIKLIDKIKYLLNDILSFEKIVLNLMIGNIIVN